MRKNHTRIERLKGRGDLKIVFESPSTRSVKEWGAKLLLRPNDLAFSRLGIVLKRGFSSSVVRNRSKRCVREFVRQFYHHLPGGFDLVFVLYPPPSLPSFSYPPLIKRLLSRSPLRVEPNVSPLRKDLIDYE